MTGIHRAAPRGGWMGYVPYLAVIILVVLPMTVMAALLAVRAGMYRVSGTPDPRQTGIFLTFIGGALGTSVTVLGMLFTWQHNSRERHRLGLDTVIKSLDSLEVGKQPRVAGVLSSMIQLGQPRVAMRVLAPAWNDDQVDAETATWLIGQVLPDGGTRHKTPDGDHADMEAIAEAAVLLKDHARELTKESPGSISFPGHFLKKWETHPELPPGAKRNLLLAMGRMLASRERKWWTSDDRPPEWPTAIFEKCALTDSHQEIKLSAAVLLNEMHAHFQQAFERHFADRPSDLDEILLNARNAQLNGECGEFVAIAAEIRAKWEPAVQQHSQQAAA